MNYFEFYGIPLSFKPDVVALKKIFYANSKKYHPDFYTLESAEKQAEILELSTLNTEAFKTLADFDKRIKYLLELEGVLKEEGNNGIPQDFLVDMMDINEAMMELEFDYDEIVYKKVEQDVQGIENQLFGEIKDIVEKEYQYPPPQLELEKMKNFYLKRRYLLRIKENLTKFAPLN
jgi:molecular chaperone HscB